VRFLFSGICFNLALLGLTGTNLAAIAVPLQLTSIDRIPNYGAIALQVEGSNNQPISNSKVVSGIGVEFIIPSRFTSGSPADKDLKATATNIAKKSPIMASVMSFFEDSEAKAVAIDASRQGNLEIVLVANPPVPIERSLEAIKENFLPGKYPSDEFQPVDTKISTIGTRKVLQVTGNLKIKGSTAKVSMGFFREGDKLFHVTYVYGSQSARQSAPIFAQIISTFKVTAKVPTTNPLG
jgi:hypothetical protein